MLIWCSHNPDQHVWIQSLDGSDGATDHLWCHSITHLKGRSSATHSPRLSGTDDRGTSHSHRHAICQQSIVLHKKTHPQNIKHTQTQGCLNTGTTVAQKYADVFLIFKAILTRWMRSVPNLAVWTGERTAQMGRRGKQMSWMLQEGDNESKPARIPFHCGPFLSGSKPKRLSEMFETDSSASRMT